MSLNEKNEPFPLLSPQQFLTLPLTLPNEIMAQLSKLPFLSGIQEAYVSGNGLKQVDQNKIDTEVAEIFIDTPIKERSFPSREHTKQTDSDTEKEASVFGSLFNEREQMSGGSEKDTEASIFGSSFDGAKPESSPEKQHVKASLF